MFPAPTRGIFALLIVVLATAALSARAVDDRAGESPVPGAPRKPGVEMPAGYVPPLLQKARDAARVTELTGAYVPGDIVFSDSTGRVVELGEFFSGERPVIIQMAWYRCPALCGEITRGMVRSMRALAGELKLSEDFTVLTVSFDSREPPALAASNKEAVVEVMGRSTSRQSVQEGWHFLVGDDRSINALAEAIGYEFAWIEEAQQYSHPAAIVVLTPDGKISRYLYDANYDPTAMRLTLINASQGTITPGLKDAFILSCFDYNPEIGKYTATARTLMRSAGATTVVTLAGIIGFLLLAERRGKLRRLASRGTSVEDLEEASRDRDDLPPPRTAFSG